ncbi:MAG: TRAP-type transporter system substrate-binding component [Saliniramus fredricksonii]|uniref:TRAP-type C4-dicarboxylate transport system, substrate-binding protein n=1 Tax=Saliniramus fredricksonii TaxID=1653334 RepID=A0A0P7XA75_9HYPH|nr:TRAP transporter substrate-binding protein [Saliniramus fredricksonii]KPQ12144.1 MAG: TRAP-type transporter system substrate-binding component [Saliniramus fredricksonii]SCC78758.1 TRAP-type C4-dicarboxylate transport system, substrate-binding protein [Saliniramus fredricksonii]
MKAFARATMGLGLVVGMTAGASAQSWDMPTPYPDGNFHTINISQFADDVREATDGTLDITVHSAGSLIRHPEIKRSIRSGIAPIGEVLVSLHANEAPIYGLDSVPFLATSYDDARALYEAQRPALEEALAEEGLTLLFSVPWPPQGIYAKMEITSIDDMEGLRFRTYNPGTGRIAALSGATPVQVEVADLPTAFATGRVEATITSPATGVDSQFWDFLEYYHDTQAWIPRNMVIVNSAAFEALDDATREAVLDAAATAEERGWASSEEVTVSATAELAENGINVITPSDALREGFQEIGAQIATEWAEEAGESGASVLETYESLR